MKEKSNTVASDNSEEQISLLFEEHLNQHGYSFQNAIARKIREMSYDEDLGKRSFFEVIGIEMPVTADRNTHIDIVGWHSNNYGLGKTRYYLVGECKKSDPGYAAWCFAKTPITWADHYQSLIQFDLVEGAGGDRYFRGQTEQRATDLPIMNLGVALTIRESNNSKPKGDREAINEAVNQVLRGVGGFINYITSAQHTAIELQKDEAHVVVPVVFTTAQIYTTDSNIALADLSTGKLSKGSIEAKKADWIWYNYNRSTQLSHGLKMVGKAAPGESDLFREFTRTIAIVGPSGLESFLRYNFHRKFG